MTWSDELDFNIDGVSATKLIFKCIDKNPIEFKDVQSYIAP
jgi:hypothetical protein